MLFGLILFPLSYIFNLLLLCSLSSAFFSLSLVLSISLFVLSSSSFSPLLLSYLYRVPSLVSFTLLCTTRYFLFFFPPSVLLSSFRFPCSLLALFSTVFSAVIPPSSLHRLPVRASSYIFFSLHLSSSLHVSPLSFLFSPPLASLPITCW